MEYYITVDICFIHSHWFCFPFSPPLKTPVCLMTRNKACTLRIKKRCPLVKKGSKKVGQFHLFFSPQAVKSSQASFHAVEANMNLLNYNHAKSVILYINACKKPFLGVLVLLFCFQSKYGIDYAVWYNFHQSKLPFQQYVTFLL